MSARTRSPQARPKGGRSGPDDKETSAPGWADTPVRIRLALILSIAAAALLVAGPAVGLVDDQPPPGYASMPLLVALAAVAPLLAAWAVWTHRPALASGVLIGSALVAPGRALLDLQFAQDALQVARPEVMVPGSLAPLDPRLGVWLLVCGHVLTAVAGVLAAGRAGARPGSDAAGGYAEEIEDLAGAPTVAVRRRSVGWALGCGTAAAVGLLMAPFGSDNAFVLSRPVIDNPTLVRSGGLLVAFTVLLGCVFAATSGRPARTRGITLGVAAAVMAVTVPSIVAGLVVDRLQPEPGPYLALVSMGVLVAVVFLVPVPDADGSDLGAQASPGPSGSAEVRLEVRRLHVIAATLGVLAGLAALGGAIGRQLVVDIGLELPASYASRQLAPAGLLVVVLAGALLTPRWATAVRPAFTVSLAAILLTGASTLDTALTGSGISDAVHVGPGAWATGLATLLAVSAAGCAVLAGGAERDDVDLTERRTDLTLLVPCAAAALLAVGAFGLPAMRAPGFVPPGIWSHFRLTSWGLLLALAVVLLVCALAPVSRPARSVSLLLGAVALVGVRVLELPLTADRAPNAEAGAGTWLSLACAVALAVAALVAVTRHQARPAGE